MKTGGESGERSCKERGQRARVQASSEVRFVEAKKRRALRIIAGMKKRQGVVRMNHRETGFGLMWVSFVPIGSGAKKGLG